MFQIADWRWLIGDFGNMMPQVSPIVHLRSDRHGLNLILPCPCLPSSKVSTRNRAFTLIEVLITSFVATCGLVAVATMFSFAISANVSNRKMDIATALLYDKMEEFKSAPLDSPIWINGDGSDDVIQDTAFTRVWEINPGIPNSVSIIVYAESPLTHRLTELIRATAKVANTF